MSDYEFYTLVVLLVDQRDKCKEVLTSIDNGPNHTCFESFKNQKRFYILSKWGSKENFMEFMKQPIEETFLKPIVTHTSSHPFTDRFELNKIFDLHGEVNSNLYKLSKSSVDNLNSFLSKYRKKHTIESFKERKSESIQLFSDYRHKETITYLSGWNNIDDIVEYVTTNPPKLVIERGDLGIIHAIDEYDVLVKLA